MSSRVLVTGFEPFAGLPRNPSADVVGLLARDATCRRAGLRTAILPVSRTRAPRELAALLRRHAPVALLMTGLARGRSAVSFERIGVNCWRAAGSREPGRRIAADGPDGLFATAPIKESLRALAASGAPVALSESAGTYACNLVLYEALRWRLQGVPGGGRPAELVAFVHLPATTESLPRGRVEPVIALETLLGCVRSLALALAKTAGGRRRHA